MDTDERHQMNEQGRADEAGECYYCGNELVYGKCVNINCIDGPSPWEDGEDIK